MLPIPIIYDFPNTSVACPIYEITHEKLEEFLSNRRAKKLDKKVQELELMKAIILQQEKSCIAKNFYLETNLLTRRIPEDVLNEIKSYVNLTYSKEQIIEQASRNYPRIESISIWKKFTSCLKSKSSQTTEEYINKKYVNSPDSIEFISVSPEELEHVQLAGLDTESINHPGSMGQSY